MSSSFLPARARVSRVLAAAAVFLAVLPSGASRADNAVQTLPFSQNWSSTGLITTANDWSGVPGIIGYRGDGLVGSTGVDPQTVVAEGTGTPINVIANQTNPNTLTTGGIAEFDTLANPVVALQGSGTARAPFLLIALNTLGQTAITVAYNVRDVDGAADNAVQPVALQFRVGSTGNFTNVPAAFVADATTGPSLATAITPVSVTLPASANNQPLVQIRMITTDAAGSDEWVGIDDISITGTPAGTTNPSGAGTASPATVFPGQASLLTVSVTPGAVPSSSGIQVSADLSSIGGSANQAFANNGGNSFSFSAVVAMGTALGAKVLPVTITDLEGRSGSTTISLQVDPPPPPLGHLVISQVYGGGGNSGATYLNDYIELYNPGTSPVDVTGWTVQYASAAGNFSASLSQPLAGVIGPGEYYLVALASGGANGADLPAANASNGDINMSATNGKVALVSNGDPATSALTPACPLTDPELIDFVGYGTANCKEGAATAPAGSNTTALFRKNDGATDTDQNGSDFASGTPNPRRTAPIAEVGPRVQIADPSPGAMSAPRDASLTVTFSEPVDVADPWVHVLCTSTGAHDDATLAGGPITYVFTPNVNFAPGENCAATITRDAVHDQDTDDASTDTDILPADYVWTFTVAAGTAPPYPPEVHLTMGNPSGAVADTETPNNYLMEKPEFALSYNREKGTPNWVSWHLSDEWTGTLVRNDTFRPDPAVPPDWYRVQATDFFSTGFDRGHMTPNADRDKETSIPINQATFLMSNMVPQAPDNNQGPWAALENDLRNIYMPGNEIYIVSGPAGIGGTGSNGFATTVANGHVTVPASTWKVALVIPKGSGDNGLGVTASARTIAVIMPNVQGIRNNDWHTYLTTVDAVEALTGYDFFANVKDEVENSIEAGVNGDNPPGAAGQSVSTEEDVPKGFTLNAVSPTNAPLSYTIVDLPTHGMVSGSGPTLTYIPVPDFNGTDSFTFRASDGARTSNTATVTVTVDSVNDAPIAADDARDTTEDSPLVLLAADLAINDISGPANESGQHLTVSSVNATADTHGTVTLDSGDVTYVPAANFNGPASFAYQVCDDGDSAGMPDPKCTVATVHVTVAAVNDDPVAAADAATTEEDTAVVIDVLANDTDAEGDGLVVTGASGATKGGVARIASGPDAGKLRYTPNANANGGDTFLYMVSDGHGGSATGTVSVWIRPQDDPPVFTFVPGAATILEQSPYGFLAQATDIDSASLTFSLVGAPTGASINPATGQFSWTPTEAQGGTGLLCAVKVRVTDGTSTTDADVVLTVAEVNQAPTLLVATSQSVALGQTLSFTAVGADADVPVEALGYGLSGAVPAGASINPASGVFTWTPTAAQAGGTFAFNVTVSDGVVTTSVAIEVDVSGPLGAIQGVLDRVKLLRNTVHDRSDRRSLDDVVDDLEDAVQPRYWDGAAHLDPRRGDKVFDEIEKAVRELVQLRRECQSRIPDAVLQGFVDDLVKATRLLAETAVADAIAAHGDPRDIAKANGDLADGNRDAARGRFDDTVRDYESAWARALKAVR